MIIPTRGKTDRDLFEIKRYGGQLSLENFRRYTNSSFASILRAEHSFSQRKHFNTDFPFSTSSTGMSYTLDPFEIYMCPQTLLGWDL